MLDNRARRKLSIIFLGGFPYPQGMAGTKRIQHAIDGMKDAPGVSIRVVVLRQSSEQNALSGVHEGIPYETVMGDLLRSKAVLMSPLLHLKAKRTIGGLFQPDQTNILFVYCAPSWDNLPTIRYARRCGYKVVFDIVEDDDLAFGVSKSLWHRVKNIHTRYATRRISSLADGIVVISSHLEAKCRRLTCGSIPLHYRPVSVDLARYPSKSQRFGDAVKLFYSGSFAKKDGVPVLLDAFDRLAAEHKDIHLVLTGRGSDEAMRGILSRIGSSPFSERIDYKGYLDDDAYYAMLNAADIPCMTRVDSGFAQAGFPFKLGEFLATGKPVIASRVSDVERLLCDRHDAMLVRPGDSGAIAAAVEYLIAHPDEAAAMGRQGREKAKAHFDFRTQGKALLEFMRSC